MISISRCLQLLICKILCFQFLVSCDQDWFTMVKTNNLVIVEKMILQGIDVNLVNSNDRNRAALSYAIENNYNELAELLLKNKANPNAPLICDEACNVPLFYGIKKNNIRIVKLLLKFGANPNYILVEDPEYLITSLFLSVFSQQFEITELLLENGANPNNEIVLGGAVSRPLVEAIEKNSLKLVKLLLKFGGDPNIGFSPDRKYQLLPLQLALSKPPIFEALLKEGADWLDLLIKYQQRILAEESEERMKRKEIMNLIKSQEMIDKSKKMIFELIGKKEFNQFKNLLESLLKDMPSKRYRNQVVLFLKDENKNTLLHKAIILEDYELIMYVLNLSVEILPELLEELNTNNLTPIDLAVKNVDILNLFMEFAYIPKTTCVIQ